jgi:uncharacterized repeat protein (TIGR01451 family)
VVRRFSLNLRPFPSLLAGVALALGAASTAEASVTLGQTSGATDGCGNGQVLLQATTAGAPSYVAQSAGVVVSWSYLAHASTPSITFKVYKPTANPSIWFLRSQSAQKTAAGSGADQLHANQLNTYTESPGLRIEANDHLGLTGLGSGTMGCIATSSASDLMRVKNPPDSVVGQDNSGFLGMLDHFKVDVSAVVEPDADGDGFGDESQDSCPTDASVHTGACPVDVSIVKTVSSGAMVGQDLTYTLAVKNNHATNPADAVNVIDPLPAGATFVSSAAGQGSCTGTTNVSCALGNLAAGQSTTVTIVVRPTAAGPLSNTASLTTTSSDTDTGNNSSTAETTVAPIPPPPAPVLSLFKLSPATFRAAKGTIVSYRVSQNATTTLKVYLRARGVKKGTRCVAPPKKKPRKKPKSCTRLLARGSSVRQDAAGPVSFRFKPRYKGKRLAPGSYRLRAVARNISGSSNTVSANFKVKK